MLNCGKSIISVIMSVSSNRNRRRSSLLTDIEKGHGHPSADSPLHMTLNLEGRPHVIQSNIVPILSFCNLIYYTMDSWRLRPS